MSALDSLAEKARAKSEQLAGQGGIKDKLAGVLAEDAAFLPKLKPELIKKRMKGEAPTDRKPAEAPKPAKKPSGSSPSPFIVIGAALVIGVAVAKWIDWRGHAHPRW